MSSPNAVVFDGDRVQWQPTALPTRSAHEVRIEVHAAGVNRADLVQRAGHYPPPPGASEVLGLEVAGVVSEVGAACEGVRLGDRVAALLAGGGYAQAVHVDHRHLLHVPPSVSTREAAAFMEVFATAWLNLQQEGQLLGREGAHILIHAAGSGVGTAAVQLGRLYGHHIFATAGSDDKLRRCRALGAEGTANRHDETPWLEALRQWHRPGVDVILDPVGASYLADNIRALKTEGRLVSIGLLSGRHASLDLGRLLTRRLRIVGSTLRSRTPEMKAALIRAMKTHLWDAWSDGKIGAIVDSHFPIQEADAAHARLASNDTFGAIVLDVPHEA